MTENYLKQLVNKRESIISKIDKTINSSIWHSHPLLSLYQENLTKLKERVSNISDKDTSGIPSKKQSQDAQENKIKIFVSLYNTDGLNLNKWMAVIDNAIQSAASRSIYQNKADIEKMISNRESIDNEGYLTINISENDIINIAAESMKKDGLGINLMDVKENALSIKNIVYFTHRDSNYIIKEDKLIPSQ